MSMAITLLGSSNLGCGRECIRPEYGDIPALITPSMYTLVFLCIYWLLTARTGGVSLSECCPDELPRSRRDNDRTIQLWSVLAAVVEGFSTVFMSTHVGYVYSGWLPALTMMRIPTGMAIRRLFRQRVPMRMYLHHSYYIGCIAIALGAIACIVPTVIVIVRYAPKAWMIVYGITYLITSSILPLGYVCQDYVLDVVGTSDATTSGGVGGGGGEPEYTTPSTRTIIRLALLMETFRSLVVLFTSIIYTRQVLILQYGVASVSTYGLVITNIFLTYAYTHLIALGTSDIATIISVVSFIVVRMTWIAAGFMVASKFTIGMWSCGLLSFVIGIRFHALNTRILSTIDTIDAPDTPKERSKERSERSRLLPSRAESPLTISDSDTP
jgi:hypothetical protein